MHPQVENFLKSQHAQQQKKINKEKNEILIDLGLYEKVFAPNEDCSGFEYPFSEWDETTNTRKMYKKQPLPVTDQEYAEILKYAKSIETQKSSASTGSITGSIIKGFAVVTWIGFFIIGICMGDAAAEADYFEDEKTFDFLTAFIWWIIGFAGGMFYWWAGDVIDHLKAIRQNTSK